jgi:hypothetical protein
MLSSIHPLGERARHNRWGRSAAAFTFGSIGAGAAVGAVFGGAASLIVPAPSTVTAMILGAAAVGAAVLDVAGIAPPGPHRQVNERWIGEYRDWVYGGAFGLQLGAGLATYVVTWGVWVVVGAELLAASAVSGAMIGFVFGLGRALPVLASRWIDRPSRLVSVSATLGRIAEPVWRAIAGATALAGVGLIAMGVMWT